VIKIAGDINMIPEKKLYKKHLFINIQMNQPMASSEKWLGCKNTQYHTDWPTDG